jgi:hypothetical protein
MTRLHKPYRPSNGTEGECFIASWCGTCGLSAAPEDLIGCSITGRTMLHDVDDADYPAEWIFADGKPRCTAWIPLGDPIPTPRCPNTIDMFDSAGPFTASSRARIKP